jgi:hypothetical protein
MRGWLVLGLALIALCVGCGGSGGGEEPGAARPEPSAPAPPAPAPEKPPAPPATVEESPPATLAADERQEIVSAWSEALNSGNNEAAADLFAPGAVVVQNGLAAELTTHADAIAFNASLPCSGRIVEMTTEGEVVTAVFELGDRTTGACDAAPGTRAAAQFLIRAHKIIAWQQIPVPEDGQAPGETSAPEPIPGEL